MIFGARWGWGVSPTPRLPLPPEKTRCPLYKRLGGPQGRSGRAENLLPTGIRSRTIQPVVSRYTDWATRPTLPLIECLEMGYPGQWNTTPPTGRRNHGRPLRRLLATWDRNGSTIGPTPWQIYDDDDDDDDDVNCISVVDLSLNWRWWILLFDSAKTLVKNKCKYEICGGGTTVSIITGYG